MNIDKFLANEPVQLTDLFGEWKQKGFDRSSAEASTKITKKLAFMRCHFAKHLKRNPMPEAAAVQFKRCDVNGKGDGEWMLVIDASGRPLATFTASIEGFVERTAVDHPVAEAAAPVKHIAKETRSAKEIQEAIPLEERHSWFNYDLAEKLTEKCLAEYDAAKIPAKTEDEE